MLTDKQEKTDRILYGEAGMSDGLIRMVMDNRGDIERCRIVQLELINKLRKEDVIDYDDDIKDICNSLTKEGSY